MRDRQVEHKFIYWEIFLNAMGGCTCKISCEFRQKGQRNDGWSVESRVDVYIVVFVVTDEWPIVEDNT